MTPEQFIAKWRRSRGQEAAGAQEWFIDLCRVVGHGTPNELDPQQEWFTFERSLREVSGRLGRADVYKRGYFAWEFKGLHRDLNEAYAQLQRYREALRNPPILVVSDFRNIEIHTNFTNKVSEVYRYRLEDLGELEPLDILRKVFFQPSELEPEITPDDVTRETADIFADIAVSMRERGIDSLEVARFLNRLVFCFFAQDVRLLPDRILTDLCERFNTDPTEFDAGIEELFRRMNEGGRFGPLIIPYFNGDLFKDPATVLMTGGELEKLVEATLPNWAHIDPSIFGTLFERVIDPAKQGLIGAEYTTEADILTVINPVIMNPLHAEWLELQGKVGALMLFEGQRNENKARLREFQVQCLTPRAAAISCMSRFGLGEGIGYCHRTSTTSRLMSRAVPGHREGRMQRTRAALDCAMQWSIERTLSSANLYLGALNTISAATPSLKGTNPAIPSNPNGQLLTIVGRTRRFWDMREELGDGRCRVCALWRPQPQFCAAIGCTRPNRGWRCKRRAAGDAGNTLPVP